MVLTGSTEPSNSPILISPWAGTFLNLCSSETIFVSSSSFSPSLILFMHQGHFGFLGSSLTTQSLTTSISPRKFFAIALAVSVFPQPLCPMSSMSFLLTKAGIILSFTPYSSSFISGRILSFFFNFINTVSLNSSLTDLYIIR